MILYHFTSYHYIESILHEGLEPSDIPVTPEPGLFEPQAVWLTTATSPGGQGLTCVESLSPEAVREFGLPPGTAKATERRIRITLAWPQSKVVPWLQWARERLDPHWLGILTDLGGGMAKAETEYLSFEAIPPDAILSIDVFAAVEDDVA